MFSKKIKIVLLSLIGISLSSVKILTGPSSIHSEIKPISINGNGDVLCKTKFTKNQMGAHMPMTIRYGFCILSEDTIIQFEGKVLIPKESEANNGYEKYFEKKKFWDSIFEKDADTIQLNAIVGGVLDNKYKFSLCNAKSYFVDKKFSTREFEKEKAVKLNKNLQKGLYGAKSIRYYEEREIHLLYDFGSILILNNESSLEEDWTEVGAEFSYYNPWVDEKGQEVNIGFDLFKVIGVLFLD